MRGELTIWDCPKCPKGKLVKVKTKNGEFLGCTEYPKCKYIQPVEKNSDSESQETE